MTNLDDDHPHLPVSPRPVGRGGGRVRVQGPRTGRPRSVSRAERVAAYAQADVWRHGRDFTARTVWAEGGETCLELHGPDGSRVRGLVRLLGPETATNSSIAFATALALGAEPEAAAAGLGAIRDHEEAPRADGPAGRRAGLRRLRRQAPAGHPQGDRGAAASLPRGAGRCCLRGVRPLPRQVGPTVRPVAQPRGPGRARARRLLRRLRCGSRGRRWADACTVPTVRAGSRVDAASTAMGHAHPGDVVVCFGQLGVARQMADAAMRHAEAGS